MVLKTKRGSELPPGAVAVSEAEALEYQKKLIHTWSSDMDVLFLKYGGYISATMTIATSNVILNFFKGYFNVHISPLLSFSYLGSSIIPSLFSYIITEKFLTSNVLLMKMDCPVCEELKFGVSQLYVGLLYPAVFGLLSFGARAHIDGTTNFPNIKTHPREFWNESFKVLKKSTKVLKFVALSQSAWILFLPYMQNKELLNVMNKAKAKEIAFDENLNEFGELENKL